MVGSEFIEVPLSTVYRVLHPKVVTVVVAVDAYGRPNGMTAAWVTPASMNPPMVCVAIAPTRYTYELIRRSRDFTVNVLGKESIGIAHYFGTVSGRDEDKFAKSRAALAQSMRVRAPYMIDALAALECRVEREFRAGDHVLVLGLVVAAHAKSEAFEEGMWNPEKAKLLLHLGEDNYTTVADEVLKP